MSARYVRQGHVAGGRFGEVFVIDNVPYPVTIVSARYGGVYEGAKWLAFPVDERSLPPEYDSDDVTCCVWWGENRDEPIGRGDSPQSAFNDLQQRLGLA